MAPQNWPLIGYLSVRRGTCLLGLALALAVSSGCGGNTELPGGIGTANGGTASGGAAAGGTAAGGTAAGGAAAGGAAAGGARGGVGGAGVGAVGGSADPGASCTVGGKTYPSGTGQIPAPDGCNQCSCLDGQLACTLIGCATPPKLCGGIAGITCVKGQYCNFPQGTQCGSGDQSGECTTVPQGCTAEYAPVCGCDGKQYGNAFCAAAAAVSVLQSGVCGSPPGSCSVTPDGISYPDGATNIPAGDNCNVCTCTKGALGCTQRPCRAPTACGARAGNTCAAAEYCAYTPGLSCGAADAESACKPRPTACSTLAQPVCGCDGKTYLNTCSAALAGSGVLQTGPCAGSGRSCMVGNATYPDGTGNIPAPDGCNICGCADGTLSCSKSACTTPKLCGGIAGRLCAATEYCAYTSGQSCGATDASSTCEPRSDVCPDLVDLVCGCDHKTYPNACVAGQAGVGYLNKGACVGN